MAVGANLKFTGLQKRKNALINKLMKARKWHGVGATIPNRYVCHKAGAPVTNTAADNPDAQGVYCLDVTNNAVYVCSSWTNGTTFTWTKVTP